MDLFKKFIKEEKGATIIEYVLMLAVAAGIIVMFSPALRGYFGDWSEQLFDDITDGLDRDVTSDTE